MEGKKERGERKGILEELERRRKWRKAFKIEKNFL